MVKLVIEILKQNATFYLFLATLRVPGALGKGLATLTFDEKFQNKRREAIKRRENQNLLNGMVINFRYIDTQTTLVQKIYIYINDIVSYL